VPPQTPPVILKPSATEWFFFFIAQDGNRDAYVWAGNAASAEMRTFGIPTRSHPDRYGFFRNCIALVENSVFFAGSSLPLTIVRAMSWQSDPVVYVENVSGSFVSDLVNFFALQSGAPYLAFISWYDNYYNDINVLDLPTASIYSQPGANATHVSTAGGRLYWSSRSEWDARTTTVTQTIYYSTDPTSDPIGLRLLVAPTVDIFKLDLAEMFVPQPYVAVRNIVLFTNWGQASIDTPFVEVWDVSAAPTRVKVANNTSIGWTMHLTLDALAWVGPSGPFLNAEDFVNANRFSAYEFIAGSGTLTDLLSPLFLTHVYNAFAFPGVGRVLWGYDVSLNTGPIGSQPVFEYKGSPGTSISPITDVVGCPGVETWVTYVRFPPVFNGTHMFFLAPGTSGPEVLAQTANSPGRSLEFYALFFFRF
jgi:hypothetical protein